MALAPADLRILENVLRALSTAARAVVLYPLTSPIPRQTIEAATAALRDHFASGATVLSLSVAREGFAFDGKPVATSILATTNFANMLRDHGVDQVDIVAGANEDDLLAFLSVVTRPAEEVRADGGIGPAVAALGVRSVLLTEVQLVTVDQTVKADERAEALLREAADDPARLGDWLATVSPSDLQYLRCGLEQLVVGAGGALEALARSMSTALPEQKTSIQDAFLSLALEPGAARDLTATMFSMMSASEIASLILGGSFGRNMLLLSNALASLPYGQVTEPVRQEILAMLPNTGCGPHQVQFLGHMLEVRESIQPELALIEADFSYRTIVQAGMVRVDDVIAAREATMASVQTLPAVGLRAMLILLDQHPHISSFMSAADNIASTVPRLIARSEFEFAALVMRELEARETSRAEWPDLPTRLRETLASVIDPECAGVLVHAAATDPPLVPLARELLRFAGDATVNAVALQAISLGRDGLSVGHELLGRRLVDLLNGLAPSVQPNLVGPVVERLAAEGDPRSMKTVEALMTCQNEQVRRETITALAPLARPDLLPILDSALRDPSLEIASIAARMIAQTRTPGSASLLGDRLLELDIDNVDFAFARELIGALARTPEPAADEALRRVATRRTIIKRGRYADVQRLVSQAQAARRQGGAA